MIRVFEYGLLQPTEGQDVVGQQVLLAHRYYNQLIEIERDKREEIARAQEGDEDIGPLAKMVEDAEGLLASLRDQKKRSKSHDGKVAPPARGAIGAAREILKGARASLKEAKAAARERLKPIYEEISQRAADRKRAARTASGVFWGTYLLVEQAADLAAKTSAKTGSLPHFRRWNGEGLLGIQIQSTRPLSGERIFGDDSRVRIEPVDLRAWDPEVRRGDRRRASRTVLHMRVGRERGQEAAWPMVMHRPLPQGSQVKWVKVVRRRFDNRFRYRYVVQITVEEPDALAWRGGPPEASAVAVNLGWRKLPDGSLRVATWADTQGQTGHVTLDVKHFRSRIEHAESLRSIRDRLLDGLKAAIKDMAADGLEVLNEASDTVTRTDVQRWKSPGRFHRLLAEMKDRGDAPEELVAAVEEWHHRDRHLAQWEVGDRRHALRFRREEYRKLARRLASRYPVLVIEDYDLRRIVQNPERVKEPSAQRVESAPSEARQILRSTGTREGCRIIDGDSPLATQECHICGYGRGEDERWDASPRIEHTCEGCGATWDQDVNNAHLLLARASEAIQTPAPLAAEKPKRVGRFHKRDRKEEARA
jgi:transposase